MIVCLDTRQPLSPLGGTDCPLIHPHPSATGVPSSVHGARAAPPRCEIAWRQRRPRSAPRQLDPPADAHGRQAERADAPTAVSSPARPPPLAPLQTPTPPTAITAPLPRTRAGCYRVTMVPQRPRRRAPLRGATHLLLVIAAGGIAQIKRCCWRTSMEPRRQVGGTRDHTRFEAAQTRDAGFASSIIKSGTYTTVAQGLAR